MPTQDTSLRVRLRLVHDALEEMANAIGPSARNADGEPKKCILLGYGRDNQRVLDRTHDPLSDTIGTVAARHAVARGGKFRDSVDRMWEPVVIDVRTGEELPFDADVLRNAWFEAAV